MKKLVINSATFSRYLNSLRKQSQVKDWKALSEKFHSMEGFVKAKQRDLNMLRLEWFIIARNFFNIKSNKAELKKQGLGTWAKFAAKFFALEETQVKYFTRAAEVVINEIRPIQEVVDNIKAVYKLNVEPVKGDDGKVKRTQDGLRVIQEVETTTPTDKVAEIEDLISKKKSRLKSLNDQVKKLRTEIPALEKELAELKKAK